MKSRHVRRPGVVAEWYRIQVEKRLVKRALGVTREAVRVITVSAFGIYESLRRADANRIGCWFFAMTGKIINVVWNPESSATDLCY